MLRTNVEKLVAVAVQGLITPPMQRALTGWVGKEFPLSCLEQAVSATT